MSSLSTRQAGLIAGVLGIGLAAAFLAFAGFAHLVTISATPVQSYTAGYHGNSAASSQVTTPGSLYSTGDQSIATVRAAPSDAIRTFGILGLLGGASLGVAVFSTAYISKRVESNGKADSG